MPDNAPDFAAANKAREKRVIEAIIDFDWGNYRLSEMDSLAAEIRDELDDTGESDRMDWARDLAKAVMVAARPISLAEMPDGGGKV